MMALKPPTPHHMAYPAHAGIQVNGSGGVNGSNGKAHLAPHAHAHTQHAHGQQQQQASYQSHAHHTQSSSLSATLSAQRKTLPSLRWAPVQTRPAGESGSSRQAPPQQQQQGQQGPGQGCAPGARLLRHL